jgi:hypothetical protein
MERHVSPRKPYLTNVSDDTSAHAATNLSLMTEEAPERPYPSGTSGCLAPDRVIRCSVALPVLSSLVATARPSTDSVVARVEVR